MNSRENKWSKRTSEQSLSETNNKIDISSVFRLKLVWRTSSAALSVRSRWSVCWGIRLTGNDRLRSVGRGDVLLAIVHSINPLFHLMNVCSHLLWTPFVIINPVHCCSDFNSNFSLFHTDIASLNSILWYSCPYKQHCQPILAYLSTAFHCPTLINPRGDSS